MSVQTKYWQLASRKIPKEEPGLYHTNVASEMLQEDKMTSMTSNRSNRLAKNPQTGVVLFSRIGHVYVGFGPECAAFDGTRGPTVSLPEAIGPLAF